MRSLCLSILGLLISSILYADETSPLPPEGGIKITQDSQLVIDAGKKIGVKSIATGEMNETLQKFAEQHAADQARWCQQGHQGWETRFHQLERLLPDYTGFQEIAAESWPWQTEEESGPEMFKSWRQSSGHWQVANSKCSIWGYSMAKGKNGIYYGCGIVAHRKGAQ